MVAGVRPTLICPANVRSFLLTRAFPTSSFLNSYVIARGENDAAIRSNSNVE